MNQKNQSRRGVSAQANAEPRSAANPSATGIRLLPFSTVIGIAMMLFPGWAASGEEIPIPQKRPDIAAPAQQDIVAPEPPVVHRAACPALLSGRFDGRLAPALREGPCGEDSPIEMLAISGVQLPGKPLVNCAMATEFAAIVETARELSHQLMVAELRRIATGPGYECRHRNRAQSGKLSEHAYANALDIVAFEFSDGRKITVAKDWPHLPLTGDDVSANESAGEGKEGDAKSVKPEPPAKRASTPEARFLVELHGAACKRFTTVLGPDANADHHEHFHFDLGCHGRDCTYLICE